MPLPVWAPTLEKVAAYVPRRTLVGAVDGYGITHRTFDGTTHPSSTEVNHLIADACNWVTLAAGTIDATLTDSAASVAALRTAGLVELTYPDNREDLTDGETLLKQAEAMRKDLAAANVALVLEDPATTGDNLLPLYSFPEAVTWGDQLLL